MKVYITGSTENIKENRALFEVVIRKLNKMGFVNTNLYLQELLNAKPTDKKENDIYSKTRSVLRSSHLLVAEVSYPSMSVGFLIEHAINSGLPVLCICKKELAGNIPNVFQRYHSDSFKMILYTVTELEDLLDKEISNLKKHKIKLNVFLDSKLDNFLKLEATKRGINKSQFLRELILEKMKNTPTLKSV